MQQHHRRPGPATRVRIPPGHQQIDLLPSAFGIEGHHSVLDGQQTAGLMGRIRHRVAFGPHTEVIPRM
jgi:hypothetical protein